MMRVLAIWSCNVIGWILGFTMDDYIEVATLVKQVLAIIAFAFGIYISILTIKKRREEKKK